MNAPTDYQLSVLAGMLNARKCGVPYAWHDVRIQTRQAMLRDGLVENPDRRGIPTVSDLGERLAKLWIRCQGERRRCA